MRQQGLRQRSREQHQNFLVWEIIRKITTKSDNFEAKCNDEEDCSSEEVKTYKMKNNQNQELLHPTITAQPFNQASSSGTVQQNSSEEINSHKAKAIK